MVWILTPRIHSSNLISEASFVHFMPLFSSTRCNYYKLLLRISTTVTIQMINKGKSQPRLCCFDFFLFEMWSFGQMNNTFTPTLFFQEHWETQLRSKLQSLVPSNLGSFPVSPLSPIFELRDIRGTWERWLIPDSMWHFGEKTGFEQ